MFTDTSHAVHEAEVQRQHPRVRIPASLHLEAKGRAQTYELIDISAGGIGFDAQGDQFRVGRIHRGTLKFSIDPMGMTLPVNFRVCNADQENGRVGCAFEDLDGRQIALLRQLINAYMAGEVVSVGDVLTTLSRDNHAAPRKSREAAC